MTSPSASLQWPRKRSPEQILGHSRLPLPSPTFETDLGTFYQEDNATILRALPPESVALVYIDPPYATGREFKTREQEVAYSDLLTGVEYLDFLYERLVLLHRVLSPTGTVYLHLDQRMVFEAKLLMDEVFGNFQGCITRQKCAQKNVTRTRFGNVTDHILFYTKSTNYTWNRQYQPWTQDRATAEYRSVDPDGRRYKTVPIHAPGERDGDTGRPWRGRMPPKGKHWCTSPENLDAWDAEGRIHWSKNGRARKKIYLDESPGVPVLDLWLDVPDVVNQNSSVTGYPTEKSPELLRRIIEASSNPGDLVLDCFAGSGTTLEVARDLGREWVGVDASPVSTRTIQDRLRAGRSRMGILEISKYL